MRSCKEVKLLSGQNPWRKVGSDRSTRRTVSDSQGNPVCGIYKKTPTESNNLGTRPFQILHDKSQLAYRQLSCMLTLA